MRDAKCRLALGPNLPCKYSLTLSSLAQGVEERETIPVTARSIHKASRGCVLTTRRRRLPSIAEAKTLAPAPTAGRGSLGPRSEVTTPTTVLTHSQDGRHVTPSEAHTVSNDISQEAQEHGSPEGCSTRAQPTQAWIIRTETSHVLARPQQQEKLDVWPRVGWRRPRKESGRSARSTVGQRLGRTSAPAETGSGKAAELDALCTPRRRGRPRWNRC